MRRIAEQYVHHNTSCTSAVATTCRWRSRARSSSRKSPTSTAEGYPAAEMKHGPIALIDQNMPVVFICTRDSAYDKVVSNMQEVRARRGRIIAIATEGDLEVVDRADHVIYVPNTLPMLQPLLSVIPLQLLAYHVAVLRGCDVDQPRNLAKSVTVE